MKHFDLIVDICTNAELTRDQKAQIIKILLGPDDGWIAWNGGECPVDACTKVSVRFRDGEENKRLTAQEWVWKHFKHSRDIIAYRVIDD